MSLSIHVCEGANERTKSGEQRYKKEFEWVFRFVLVFFGKKRFLARSSIPVVLTPLDVGAEVDFVRQLRNVHFEAVLDLVEHLGISFVRHEGDSQTLQMKTL